MAGGKFGRTLRLWFPFGLTASVLAATLLTAGAAQAAALPAGAPDAGTILRGIEGTMPRPQFAAPAPAAPLTITPENKSAKLFLRDVRIDAALFTQAQLKAFFAPYLGREVTVGELEAVGVKIGQFYRAHDYLARAYLPPQTVENGVVHVVVLEASLGKVKVEPGKGTRLNPLVAEGLITARQTPGDYLHPQELETGTLLVNDLPGLSAETVLQPGAKPGDSDAVVKLREGPLLSGSVTGDDWGSRAVGEKRVLGSLALNDPWGWGDQATALAMKSQDSTYGRFAYGLPVGSSGLRVEANASVLYYDLDNVYPTLHGTGSAFTGGLDARYPFLRGQKLSLFGTVGYEHRHLIDYVGGQTTDNRSLDAATFGLNLQANDGWGGGGATSASVNAVAGHANLSDNPASAATDAATARTQGDYAKLTAQVSRGQRLAGRLSGLLSLSGQWALTNLDSSEQFSLGGATGLRAYPVSEASGDSGWLSQAELHYALLENLQAKAFYDMGAILLHHSTWTGWSTGNQPNSYFLQGIGAGLGWTPLPALSVQASVAQRLGSNPGHDANGNDADGAKGATKLWVQATYRF